MASEKMIQFKKFAQDHPKLVEEVRKKDRTWQQIYEEWVIFGEDHEIWDPYKKEEKSSDDKRSSSPKAPETIANLFSMLKKVDYDDLQKYLSQFGGALTNVQKLMEQFQSKGESSASQSEHSSRTGSGQSGPPPQNYGMFPPGGQQQPFPYRRD